MKKLTVILLIIFILYVFNKPNELENKSDENLYILYTKTIGSIKCNYLNTRDGIYIDYKSKNTDYIISSNIDSVIVLAENFWTCGPRDKNIKYINN